MSIVRRSGLVVLLSSIILLGSTSVALAWHINSVTIDCPGSKIVVTYGGWSSSTITITITDLAGTTQYFQQSYPDPGTGQNTQYIDLTVCPGIGTYKLKITGTGGEASGQTTQFTLDCYPPSEVPEFDASFAVMAAIGVVPVLLLRNGIRGRTPQLRREH